jgi:hypothetical protein
VVQLPEGELSPNGLALSKENPWLGCMKARGALMDGRVLAVRDGVPSPEDCCRLCRGLEDAGGGVCNVWNFCSREGGCRWGGVGWRVAARWAAGQPTAQITQNTLSSVNQPGLEQWLIMKKCPLKHSCLLQLPAPIN